MITPSHTLLFNKLDKSKIDKVQIVRTPTATVQLADSPEVVKFGGYKAIVHYNRDKEIQHRKERNDKRFRQLRKDATRSRRYISGDDLPAVTLLDLGRRT